MTAHLTRVKARMSIHAHRKVRGLLEGEYASMHTGRSMDFNDLREYVRGDDVKDIDWKASARSRALLIKRYAAARKHTILMVASTGRSMAAMNDLDVPKRDLAVMVAGVVGYLAVRHGDRVSLAWGDSVEQHQMPPASGELNLERRLGAIHDNTLPTGPPADLTAVLKYVARTVRRRTILVVISDEYTIDPELSAVLRRLTVQHELLFVSIGDLDPTTIHSNGNVVDIDSGHVVPEWARYDEALRREYAALLTGQATNMRRELDALNIVHETVHDDASAIRAVLKLLERHRHAGRR
ncbi:MULTISPECIES: DUF58 domain-containing protein [unclassified Nocardioides]|uniref:DUF58 domain-containing protein n=1 Tax=unclassified Nocardioides TaxID=2615069 RepID=UPI0007028164|nr:MULTISPECIES: DUF58 domain-containing protein [unclassified Nocardioides]